MREAVAERVIPARSVNAMRGSHVACLEGFEVAKSVRIFFNLAVIIVASATLGFVAAIFLLGAIALGW